MVVVTQRHERGRSQSSLAGACSGHATGRRTPLYLGLLWRWELDEALAPRRCDEFPPYFYCFVYSTHGVDTPICTGPEGAGHYAGRHARLIRQRGATNSY